LVRDTSGIGLSWEILVVYHLQGQTGRFTVWENGKDNSGMVNSVPDSHSSKKGRISLWNTPSGKKGIPFQTFRCSRKFRLKRPEKSGSNYFLTTDFPETFCKWQTTFNPPLTFATKLWNRMFLSYHETFVLAQDNFNTASSH